MPGGTMSDWEKSIREKIPEKIDYADSISTDKEQDMNNLKKTGLPQYDEISVPYQEFNEGNELLFSFFRKYIELDYGFCVRAIPNKEGLRKGYTRKNEKCFFDFNRYKKFLDDVVGQDGDLFKTIISNWRPNGYGGVILSGIEDGRVVRGEIGTDLEKLTLGKIKPLSGFIYDRKKLGHMTDKTRWLVEEEKEDKIAREYLWKVFREYIATGDCFDPFIWEGYFEFIIPENGTWKDVKFLDYKLYKGYLK